METHIRTPFLAFATPQYLEVPLFQRPYVWQQEEQWEPLWEDVRRLADLRLASPQTEVQHFLGAIVLQLQTAGLGDLMTHQVIDGQQRLTTLQVLFDAAEGALNSRGQASLANRLRSFTHNDESFVRPGAPVLKLKHANKDGAAFIEVMNAESPVDYEALKHSRHRIVGAHSYFASAISEWLDEEGEERVPARAETLTHVLSNGLQMVVIALTPQENSQEIFETLNARGTPLTAADLIKNFVFQRLDVEGADTREAYDKVWPFDTKFWEQDVSTGRYTVSRSSLFLNHWLTARTGEEVRLQGTFARFKSFVEHEAGQPMLTMLHEIREQAEQYRAWQEAAESFDRHLNPVEMCFYRMAAVDSHALKPLLLWLHAPGRSLPAEQIAGAIRAAESWLMRRALLRLTSADAGRVIADIIRSLPAAPPEQVADHVTQQLALQQVSSTYWPGDAELERALTSEPVYTKLSARRLRPVLEAIENRWRAETGGGQVQRWNLAIEHVLPRAWEQTWPVEGLEAQGERAAAVHRLGNLTLLPERLNAKVSNDRWESKRSKLQEHNTILLNSRLLASVGEGTWDEEGIRRRTAAMIEAIEQEWPVPPGHTGEVVGPRVRNASYVEVADLVVAGLLQPGTVVRLGRGEFKHVTGVVCDNGDIQVNGERHSTPSGAAWSVMKRPSNGWYDWMLEDGRRLADVRAVYLGKEQARERSSFDWERLHAVLGAIPAGSWTSYGAVAEALGTSAQAVGNHVGSCTRCPNAHRVLQYDGRVAPGFKWVDPSDTRDPVAVLATEGIVFTDGLADPDRRLHAGDLQGLALHVIERSEGTNYYRCELGRGAMHFEDAREKGYVGTGWLAGVDLTPYLGGSPDDWHQTFDEMVLETDQIEHAVAGVWAVGQTWMVAQGMKVGDVVLTPTGRRSYGVAVIAGPYQYVPGVPLPHQRPVDWLGIEIEHDDLGEKMRNTLRYGGTVQNLNAYAEELGAVVARLRGGGYPVRSDAIEA